MSNPTSLTSAADDSTLSALQDACTSEFGELKVLSDLENLAESSRQPATEHQLEDGQFLVQMLDEWLDG